MIIEPHRKWLNERGISDTLIERFAIHTHDAGGSKWLRLPYVEHGKVANHKWRTISKKNHRMDTGAPLILWNHAALVEAAESGVPLIITEGEWDALTAILCQFPLTVSVPNGAPQEKDDNPWDAKRYEWFHRHKELLDRVRSFVLATDGDNAGRVLAADLARLLGPERCQFITYPDGCKDLNEVLVTFGEKAVTDTLATAKPYPVRGLYKLEDFPEQPEFNPIQVGVDGLNDMFPLVFGTFSIITGWAGHGKSSLLMLILANLMKAGIPIALGSFETMPKPVLQRQMRAAIYRCSADDPRVRQPGPADAVMDEKLRIIANMGADDDADLTIEGIIETAIVAVIRDGVRLLVLDPWNEIEHKRGQGETETEYVSRAIRLLKRFARDYGCAVWVVAHPRKPSSDGSPKPPSLYDLAGSAHFANKADYGLVAHRDDLATPLIEVRVVKKRMGLPGRIGVAVLAFNHLTSSYDLEFKQ